MMINCVQLLNCGYNCLFGWCLRWIISWGREVFSSFASVEIFLLVAEYFHSLSHARRLQIQIHQTDLLWLRKLANVVIFLVVIASSVGATLDWKKAFLASHCIKASMAITLLLVVHIIILSGIHLFYKLLVLLSLLIEQKRRWCGDCTSSYRWGSAHILRLLVFKPDCRGALTSHC